MRIDGQLRILEVDEDRLRAAIFLRADGENLGAAAQRGSHRPVAIPQPEPSPVIWDISVMGLRRVAFSWRTSSVIIAACQCPGASSVTNVSASALSDGSASTF